MPGYHHSSGAACCVGQGEECTACGVSCGNGGGGGLVYMGSGQGDYIQETTYRYVGHGGDFGVMRRRRDFTIICCLPLLLLVPLLLWWLWPTGYDCDKDFATWPLSWTSDKQVFCCATENKGCPVTTTPSTTPQVITIPPTPPPTPLPTPPPTPLPTPPTTRPPTPSTSRGPPGDPFNCAIDVYEMWGASKKQWCCSVHHICGPVTTSLPYDCAAGFWNWQNGWSVGKKQWCCQNQGKGCPAAPGGCVTTSAPYDCDAGFWNWHNGWSVAKKQWCCQNTGKGCPDNVGGC